MSIVNRVSYTWCITLYKKLVTLKKYISVNPLLIPLCKMQFRSDAWPVDDSFKTQYSLIWKRILSFSIDLRSGIVYVPTFLNPCTFELPDTPPVIHIPLPHQQQQQEDGFHKELVYRIESKPNYLIIKTATVSFLFSRVQSSRKIINTFYYFLLRIIFIRWRKCVT